jgi:predicted DNA-binding transcriptional regulator AlpA
MEPEWVDDKTLHHLTSIPTSTINRWRRQGLIPWSTPPGTRKVLYPWKEIKDWLARGRVETVKPWL